MRRPSLWFLSAWLLLAAGCAKKDAPSGPFAPLVARLPAECDLVALVDLAALSRDYTDLEQELMNLPAVAQNPGIRQLLEEQQGLLRSLLKVVQAKLGLDPLRDLSRAALGLVVMPEGDPQLVVLVEGAFPTDLFTRLGLAVSDQKLSGHEVFSTPDGAARLALLDGKLLVVASADRMAAVLQAAKIDARLLGAHPGLFGGGGQGFELRASFRMPEALRVALDALGSQPGLATLVGLRQVYLDVGPEVELAATAADARTADNLKALLEAQAEMIAGGQHMVRGLGYWLLAADLDAIPALPPRLTATLDNRPALLASLEQFFPEPGPLPRVSADGLRVRLVAGRQALKGAALLIGVLASVAVPSFLEYQARARAADLASDRPEE